MISYSTLTIKLLYMYQLCMTRDVKLQICHLVPYFHASKKKTEQGDLSHLAPFNKFTIDEIVQPLKRPTALVR